MIERHCCRAHVSCQPQIELGQAGVRYKGLRTFAARAPFADKETEPHARACPTSPFTSHPTPRRLLWYPHLSESLAGLVKGARSPVSTARTWALVAPKGKWRSSGLAAVVDPRRCERSAKAKVASFLSAAPILNAYDLSRSANRLWIGVAVSAACRLTRILAGGGQTIGRRTFAAQAPFADPVA